MYLDVGSIRKLGGGQESKGTYTTSYRSICNRARNKSDNCLSKIHKMKILTMTGGGGGGPHQGLENARKGELPPKFSSASQCREYSFNIFDLF